MANEQSPYRFYSREQLENEAARNQKIIVALFLFLGKAVIELPLPKRNLQVTETEIRKAWSEKKSPVRILSERVPNSTFAYDVDTQEALNTENERIYKVHLQDLDLMKVGFMHHGQKCPDYQATTAEKSELQQTIDGDRRRVFDLE